VVEFNSDSSAFICECNSEGIIKIGQHLLKLSQKISGTFFLRHSVDRLLMGSGVLKL